jgi:hypothetical protein
MSKKKKRKEHEKDLKQASLYWEKLGYEEDFPTKKEPYKLHKQKESLHYQ